MRLYALDIETDTSPGRRRTGSPTTPGLDPTHDAVISVAVHSSAENRSEFYSIDSLGSEVAVLTALERLLRSADEGVIVTWNGANFDMPYLDARFAHCGIRSTLRLAEATDRPPKYEPLPGNHPTGYWASWGQHRHLDVAFAYREFAAQQDVTWSLKPVATAAGIKMVHVDASAVTELSSEELRAYNVSDVIGTAALAQRLEPAVFAAWVDARVPPRPHRPKVLTAACDR